MDKLPYELLFSIAICFDSPKDLSSFSQVSSLFLSVTRDDRIWKRLCSRLYNIKPSSNEMKQSFYDLFTKILVPYGRYLGYWKSNEEFFGGLLDVHLNLSEGTIVGEKCNVRNASHHIAQYYADDEDEEANEEFLRPIYERVKLFTIASASHQIFCHECNMPYHELPWVKTFDNDQQYFGLSQKALPPNEQSILVTHDHDLTNIPDGRDIFFTRKCTDNSVIIYHPLAIPQPNTDDNNHPLSRYIGIWVGSYGGHGLELLQLELCHEFSCPITVDGNSTDVTTVPVALVARKISGDPNIPHSQISFAAVQPIEIEENSPLCYEGIGQIAHTRYRHAKFIRTKIVLLSNDMLTVTWYALHHTSLFKRCLF